MNEFSFSAPTWLYPGQAAWHFVTLPLDVASIIKSMPLETRRGFGSIRVEVTIGKTTWQTSIFPDKKSGSYLLPIKKQVLLTEKLTVGDSCELRITILDK